MVHLITLLTGGMARANGREANGTRRYPRHGRHKIPDVVRHAAGLPERESAP